MSLLFLARFECICLLFVFAFFVFIFRIDIADIIAVVVLAIFVVVVDIVTFLTCILVASLQILFCGSRWGMGGKDRERDEKKGSKDPKRKNVKSNLTFWGWGFRPPYC